MTIDQDKLKLKIQELLGKEIIQFVLKGTGYCNNAYYVETSGGGKYIVKEELGDKKSSEQNDLVIEGRLIQKLSRLNLSVPLPKIVFVYENPKMYGYEYIQGETMKNLWGSLPDKDRVSIFRSLGKFHAEIGKKFTKEMAQESGIGINMSTDLHPELVERYKRLIIDDSIPKEYRDFVKHAKGIFDGTLDRVFFQFTHNDAHHENVLVQDKKISGIIDFGDAEYGEIAGEFYRYIIDYPDYFQHVISAYEEESGNKLSYERLVSIALLNGFGDIMKDYQKGGENRKKAERSIELYRTLLRVK